MTDFAEPPFRRTSATGHLDGLEPWVRLLVSAEPSPAEILGLAIWRWRCGLKLTSDQLGALIGANGSTVRGWERGAHMPLPRHLEALRMRGFKVPRAAMRPRIIGRRDACGSLWKRSAA